MKSQYDAVIIGSGPNGLTAAARLADAGFSVCVVEAAATVGGGLRTDHESISGFALDSCSSVHPFGAASPAFDALGLRDYGLEWLQPSIAMAHPFDDGRAGLLDRDVARAAVSLRSDARRWRNLFGSIERRWDSLIDATFQPIVRVPRHPLTLGRFGLSAMRPALKLAAGFDDVAAQSLFAGLAAHGAVRLEALQTSGPALMLGAAAGVVGWPFARGGSAAIAEALAAVVLGNGGDIVTSQRVRYLGELPERRATLLDVSPRIAVDICGSALPARLAASLLRFRHGPGVFKIDYALREPIPWRAPECQSAGTVHVGGSMLEIAGALSVVASGSIAEQPFVIVGQPTVVDVGRAPDDMHTAWAYCHVPQGVALGEMDGVVVEAIESQIERFAPGFRDVVIERVIRNPEAFEAGNPNMHGGDFAGGALDGRQLLFRPTGKPRIDPYRLVGSQHIYMCSASTPPGPGVHGMCGWNASGSALIHSLR